MGLANRISFDPDPAQAGQALDICYDFSGLGAEVTEVKLKLKWSPDNVAGPTELTVTRVLGCAGVTVPVDATGLLVEDTSGNSADNAVAVEEP